MLHTYLAKCEREIHPRALRILKMELREMHGEDGTPFFICYELLFSHPGAYSIYLSKIKAGKTEEERLLYNFSTDEVFAFQIYFALVHGGVTPCTAKDVLIDLLSA